MKKESQTTRLKEFITEIFPWMHGHQKKATADLLGAILESRSCVQASLAAEFANKVAALKRISRWLHSQRLCPRQLAGSVAIQIVSNIPSGVRVRIALDWTQEYRKHLLVASLIIGRRAIPMYWETYGYGTIDNQRGMIERQLIQQVIELWLQPIARSRIIVTADRGFADVRLFDLLDQLGVGFVIRTSGNRKVFYDRQWRKLRTLTMKGNQRRRGLGRLRYCQSNPRRYYLIQSRSKDSKGQWSIWWLVTNRNFSAFYAIDEYSRRWGCECGFKDAKDLFGLAKARIENVDAYARIYTLIALALLLLAKIGCAFLAKGKDAQRALKHCFSRRPDCSELSLFKAVIHLLKHQMALWDLLPLSKMLDLNVTLKSVPN